MKNIKYNELKSFKCPLRVSIKNFASSTSASLSSAERTKDTLPPYFITGFSDGESTFSFSICKDSGIKLGWSIIPCYSIELHGKDIALLSKIQSFFGVGKISIRKRNSSAVYAVKSLKDLTNVIIPHFIKYPLLTQKRVDFGLFKLVCELMSNKEHLTMAGLIKIVSIKASLGKGLSTKLTESFPGIIPVDIPFIKTTAILDNAWVSGFVSAEGCFECVMRKSQTTKTGFQILLRFSINQHSRDTLLFKAFLKHWSCGVLRGDFKKPVVLFSVSQFSDILNIIIPFFEKYPVQGAKSGDYADFCRVALLMKDKAHLTVEGLNQIKNIKSGMNSKREHVSS